MEQLNKGGSFVLDKKVSMGNIIVLIMLTVGMVSSYTRMEINQIHTVQAIEENAESIKDNRMEHKDILNEVKESNRVVSIRIDRLLELELQSRKEVR